MAARRRENFHCPFPSSRVFARSLRASTTAARSPQTDLSRPCSRWLWRWLTCRVWMLTRHRPTTTPDRRMSSVLSSRTRCLLLYLPCVLSRAIAGVTAKNAGTKEKAPCQPADVAVPTERLGLCAFCCWTAARLAAVRMAVLVQQETDYFTRVPFSALALRCARRNSRSRKSPRHSASCAAMACRSYTALPVSLSRSSCIFRCLS